MKLTLIALAAFLFVSCDGPNDPAPAANTRHSINYPDTVGQLPDGRLVKCFIRDMGSDHDQYVYFIENPDGVTSTITVNQTLPQGKTTYNQVSVTIDGKEYKLAEKP